MFVMMLPRKVWRDAKNVSSLSMKLCSNLNFGKNFSYHFAYNFFWLNNSMEKCIVITMNKSIAWDSWWVIKLRQNVSSKYIKIIEILSLCIYQKLSSMRFSIEHDEAILTPCLFNIAALSIPLSSAFSISRKSPTLCDTGRNTNWHFSWRLGSGQTMLGSPRI